MTGGRGRPAKVETACIAYPALGLLIVDLFVVRVGAVPLRSLGLRVLLSAKTAEDLVGLRVDGVYTARVDLDAGVKRAAGHLRGTGGRGIVSRETKN
jgi:hypothetical protein